MRSYGDFVFPSLLSYVGTVLGRGVSDLRRNS
jgi:hypothetical protein